MNITVKLLYLNLMGKGISATELLCIIIRQHNNWNPDDIKRENSIARMDKALILFLEKRIV